MKVEKGGALSETELGGGRPDAVDAERLEGSAVSKEHGKDKDKEKDKDKDKPPKPDPPPIIVPPKPAYGGV